MPAAEPASFVDSMLVVRSIAIAEGSFPFVFVNSYHTSFHSKGLFVGLQQALPPFLFPFHLSFENVHSPSSFVSIA